ncbi:hypothetical protein [Hydrogenophaga sp.]|uniref:hypothetical protein n=1 Tax=Hydrogenophaga sp. TaxID=1904254 RepID=UPI003D09ED0C
MTLDDIKDRCFITEEGCWEWRGALSDGRWPRVHAPNHSKPGSPKEVQGGRRAVWQIATGKPIPKGWRVFGTCNCETCLNPEHMDSGTTAKVGRFTRRTGRFKCNPARIAANRRLGRNRAALTAEQVAAIQQSDEPGTVWAKRLNVSRQTVSRARNGLMVSLASANPFAGLVKP